jgi:hypothetical protein
VLFSRVFVHTEPRSVESRPRRLSSLRTVRPAFASQRLDLQTFRLSDVLFPAPASGPQVLLLSKLKAPINYAESTLLQVLILKELKVPLESITFEKQGEGSPLWLTNCSKRVSIGNVRWNPNLPPSVHSSKFRIPQVLCLPLLRKHPGCGGFLPISELFHWIAFANRTALPPFSLLSPFRERAWTNAHGVVYRS